jgi:hypothetical protein
MYIVQFESDHSDQILSTLKSLGSWMHYFSNSIILYTEYDAVSIYEQIENINKNKYTLVIKLDQSNYYGWMPEEAWNWIQERKK